MLQFFPKHHTYIEVFGGSAALLFSKPISNVEIYNDIDDTFVSFFRLLQNKSAANRFYEKCLLTPCSRKFYNECHETWQSESDLEERIYKWFVVIKQSFIAGGQLDYWSSSKKKNKGEIFAKSVRNLPEVIERLSHVQIECDTWEKIIPRYDSSDSFFYLDPPYLPSTRRSGGYSYEMTLDDHSQMVKMLSSANGKIMLSGYDNKLYDQLGYNRIDFKTHSYMSSSLQKGKDDVDSERIESIWINYDIPQQTLF